MLQKKWFINLTAWGFILVILLIIFLPKTAFFKRRSVKKAVDIYLKDKYSEELIVEDILVIGGFLGIGADYSAVVFPENNPWVTFDVWYEYEEGEAFLADSYPSIYWSDFVSTDIQEYIYGNIGVPEGLISYHVNVDADLSFEKMPTYEQIMKVSYGSVLEIDFVEILDESNKSVQLDNIYTIMTYASNKYTIDFYKIRFYDSEKGIEQRLDLTAEQLSSITEYTELEQFLV